MSYHPRIETTELTSFVTSRSRNSELWFVNNIPLENSVLGYAAKYSKTRKIKLYGLALEGSHMQFMADFPEANRASFTRDLNSSVARSVARYSPNYPGGRLWARRYSAEYLGHPEDLEKYFFYLALQPVNDGLVDRISDYPGYNFFNDAVSGNKKKYKVVNWSKYNDARRWGKIVNIKDYIVEYELVYNRLPGYENLSQHEYKKLMLVKLEEHRIEVLKERAARGKTDCLGRAKLLQIKPGTKAKNPKVSGRYDHRPRVLSISHERRHALKNWYFSIYSEHRDASERYRLGEVDVEFPPGTYKPPKFTCACSETLNSIMEI